MPRSVQQSIPIDRIYADGVWQSENVFSLMWQISDINYAMQSDTAKQNILTQLGTVYAGIPADCWMQVCIVSQRMDEKAFARDVLYHRENDGFDALRAERNRQIKANARENGNVVQHKYIIVSTNKPGVKEARERFVQVQGHLLSAFSALECAVTPLDNRARLEVLHKFFRISEEGRFNFEFDNCAKLGQDFRSAGFSQHVSQISGINVDQTRIIATMISTVLAAWGQIIYLQNMGTLNTYNAHTQIGMFSVASLLVGGASTSKANIKNAIFGTILFNSMFIMSPEIGQSLFGQALLGEYFRTFMVYGVIGLALGLYVWKALKQHRAAAMQE